MNYQDFASINTEVRGDLDMLDETIVTDAQMIVFMNKGIEIAEAQILTIYEDYFRTKTDLPQIQGQQAYSLPSNIYADKIRGIMWSNGAEIYEVKRLKSRKNAKVMEQIAHLQRFGGSMYYEYDIENASAATGVKLMIYPAPRATLSNVMTMWYIRHANRIVATTDVCDIPEFCAFVKSFMKYQCLAKEGTPLMDPALEEMKTQMQLMIDTLSARVPDEENEIPFDTEFYDEHA